MIDARKASAANKETFNATEELPAREISLITSSKPPKRNGKKKKKATDGPELPRRATKAQIQQRIQEETAKTLERFAKLNEIGPVSGNTSPEDVEKWMAIAATLVDDFREAKELFLADRVSIV